MAHAFLDAYRAAHPRDEIEQLDLWQAALPPFDEATIDAKFAVLRCWLRFIGVDDVREIIVAPTLSDPARVASLRSEAIDAAVRLAAEF